MGRSRGEACLPVSHPALLECRPACVLAAAAYAIASVGVTCNTCNTYVCGTTNDTGLISATHTSIELRSPGFIFTHHKIKQNSAIQYALDAVYVQA